MPTAMHAASQSIRALDRHERIRLLHLGSPLDALRTSPEAIFDVLTPGIAAFIDQAPLATPLTAMSFAVPTTTKRQRRRGRVFTHTPSSSITSSSSYEDSYALPSPSPYSSPASPISVTSFEVELGFSSPLMPQFAPVLPPSTHALQLQLPEVKPLRFTPKKPLAQPLVLSLRATPAAPFRRHSVSPATKAAEEPSTPTTATRRQRRLEKVIRTLGEDVPADAVRTPAVATFKTSKPITRPTIQTRIPPSVSPVPSSQLSMSSTKAVRRRSWTIDSPSGYTGAPACPRRRTSSNVHWIQPTPCTTTTSKPRGSLRDLVPASLKRRASAIQRRMSLLRPTSHADAGTKSGLRLFGLGKRSEA